MSAAIPYNPDACGARFIAGAKAGKTPLAVLTLQFSFSKGLQPQITFAGLIARLQRGSADV